MRPSLHSVTIGALVATLTLYALPASAHHSFAAEYDANQPITLEGKVLQVDLVNPHAWLYIEAADDDGNLVRWNIEMNSPNALIRQGINKNTVAVGTAVKIEGYRAKDGSNTVNSQTVTVGDGQPLFSGSRDTGAPER